jgi:hypothetical protein
MFTERIVGGIAVLGLSATLAACGGSGGMGGVVREVRLDTRTEPNTQEVYADMTSVIEVGKLVFPNLTLPIMDPKRPDKVYGNVTLSRSLDQKNRLVVSANLTEISKSQISQDRTLPNGTLIPVYGDQDLIVLPLDKSGKVYLDLSQNRKLLGVALAIKEFQNIGQYAPGLNLFFDIPQSNGITGIAGIFTGQGAYQNGIALFLDVTEAINRALPTAGSMRVAEASVSSQQFKTLSARAETPQDWVFVKQDDLLRSSRGRKVLGELQSFGTKRRMIQVSK